MGEFYSRGHGRDPDRRLPLSHSFIYHIVEYIFVSNATGAIDPHVAWLTSIGLQSIADRPAPSSTKLARHQCLALRAAQYSITANDNNVQRRFVCKLVRINECMLQFDPLNAQRQSCNRKPGKTHTLYANEFDRDGALKLWHRARFQEGGMFI